MPFVLDTNSDKHIAFEIMALIRKKLSKTSERLKKKSYISIGEKLFKFDKKMRKKIRELD